MTKLSDSSNLVDGKRPWIRPTLRRMKAGSAELGTRSASSDGGFTTS